MVASNTSFNEHCKVAQGASIKLPYMQKRYKVQQVNSSYSRLENLKYVNTNLYKCNSVRKDEYQLVKIHIIWSLLD